MEVKTKAIEILKKHLDKSNLAHLGDNELLWDEIVSAMNEALNVPVENSKSDK